MMITTKGEGCNNLIEGMVAAESREHRGKERRSLLT
jgi:hypothetical protein